MKSIACRLMTIFLALGLCFASLQSFAAEKSFADTKVVLQISDNDPFKQTLVLNVANNLINHYGPDQVAIEIVAFGPGLRLLFVDNANKGRIQSLADNGVRFAACGNTIRNMGKILGEDPVLNKSATVVPGGVVRILDLEKQGYKLIKP
jgi:intracellular sulfur oxidation DsrE/DsrF family protein